MEDLTPSRPASSSLEGERGLRLTLQSITDCAVFTVSPDGVVRIWNPGAERVFGWTAAEIVGQSSTVLWTPEDRAAGAPEKERRQVAASGGAHDTRWHQRKDGSRFLTVGGVYPVRNEAGDLLGFTTLRRDMSDEHEHERLLAASREQAAAEARARLVEVFDRAPSFLAVLRGPDHVFELVNEHYRQLIGERDVLGKPFATALPEVVEQGFARMVERVYRTGEPFIGDDTHVLLQRAPGERLEKRVVNFVCQPLREADGTVSGVLVHGVDLTERVRAEQERNRLSEQLRRQTQAFEATLSHISDCAYIFGLDGRFTFVNRATLDLWGKTLDQVIGKDLAEIGYAPEVVAAIDAERREVARTGRPVKGETVVRSAKDGARNMEHIFTPVFGERQAVVAVTGTSRDITTHKQTVEALRQSEARFLLAVEGAQLGQFHWDIPPTNLNWNARLKEFFWLPPDADVGLEEARQRIHPEDRKRITAAMDCAVRGEARYDVEYRICGPQGQIRWLHVVGEASRNPDGILDHFSGIAREITREKIAAQDRDAVLAGERVARTEAEHASRMKDEFLATLSHELRTPLNAILGWSNILRDGPSSPADLAEGLEIIERNARAQARIVEDLLDMSRIISGKVRLDVQRFDLAPVLEAALETVRPAADAKGIRLQAVLDPVARPVSGDPSRLQQVFWNLLSNAIKFTPREGRVQVLLELVHSHLEVSISDTGKGIPANFLPHAFDRFRQEDSSASRRYGGLGLGLAIVKQLVELHGGSGRALSAGENQGATFIVVLPLTVLQREPEPVPMEPRHSREGSASLQPPEVLPGLAGVRVVVVDDEPDARRLVAHLLKSGGASVYTAGTAPEALALVQTAHPAVLVSDIGMPDEDGYALIRRVRALPAEAGGVTPAVALTAYARAEDRVRVVQAGFQMHLAKPVEAAELLAVVARLSSRTGV